VWFKESYRQLIYMGLCSILVNIHAPFIVGVEPDLYCTVLRIGGMKLH
jgi:hypothetical protein